MKTRKKTPLFHSKKARLRASARKNAVFKCPDLNTESSSTERIDSAYLITLHHSFPTEKEEEQYYAPHLPSGAASTYYVDPELSLNEMGHKTG